MHTELVDVEDPPYRASPVVSTIGRVLDFAFGLLYTVLAVRLVLEFFGARRGAGFFELIRSISDPFYAPFQGIFPTNNIEGAHLVWPLVVAILGYMVLHAVLRGLLHLISRR